MIGISLDIREVFQRQFYSIGAIEKEKQLLKTVINGFYQNFPLIGMISKILVIMKLVKSLLITHILSHSHTHTVDFSLSPSPPLFDHSFLHSHPSQIPLKSHSFQLSSFLIPLWFRSRLILIPLSTLSFSWHSYSHIPLSFLSRSFLILPSSLSRLSLSSLILLSPLSLSLWFTHFPSQQSKTCLLCCLFL